MFIPFIESSDSSADSFDSLSRMGDDGDSSLLLERDREFSESFGTLGELDRVGVPSIVFLRAASSS